MCACTGRNSSTQRRARQGLRWARCLVPRPCSTCKEEARAVLLARSTSPVQISGGRVMSLQPQCLASRVSGACLGASTARFHHCSVSFSVCLCVARSLAHSLTHSFTLSPSACLITLPPAHASLALGLARPHLPPKFTPTPANAERFCPSSSHANAKHTHTQTTTQFFVHETLRRYHKLTPKQSRGLALVQTGTPVRSPGTPCNSLVATA